MPSHGYSTAPSGLDSPSATCRNSLSACAALYGKEAASATAVLKTALDVTTQASLEKALEDCADLARSEILVRHEGTFARLAPSAAECRQETKDALGRTITWAMRLGLEMHEVAERCAQEKLNALRPGGFSLEQRYRLDLSTGEKRLISREEERLLEASGKSGELKGTLKPDVVIHSGDPLAAHAVYDFKFPCVSATIPLDWGAYPIGHPFFGFTQGSMYRNHIAPMVARVVPRLGVTR